MESIQNWLSQKKDSNVSIKIPLRGNKLKILNMSLENSKQRASIESTTKKFTTKDTTKMLKDLQEILNLPRFPKRIECYDISNISGTNSVASMSVFNNGNPSPHNYRKFKIKSVQGINDYAMIKEVLERRFKSISQKPGSILNKFGSIKNINKSSIEEITKIPGISEKLAKQLLSISKNMQ